jgi:enamine deaminase RidA (YjgF/YER057c/UK114 family)
MKKERMLVSSGSPYESIIGFSRAVRVGCVVAVGGTAPMGPDGKTVGIGDPAAQTKQCLETIEKALNEAGASLEHVVRTRTFLTDISQWEEIGRAHGEFFGSIRPASTMVQVTAFIQPEWLVEIEADAVVCDGDDNWQNAWAASNETGKPQT